MKKVFVISDNIVSPLGLTTADNFEALEHGVSGIKLHQPSSISKTPFYASIFDQSEFDWDEKYTKFEQLLIESISVALKNSICDPSDNQTGLVISSTKGNISLLETEPASQELYKRIALHTSAELIAGNLGFVNKPVVVSNACISGILAITTGMRMIQSGRYQTVVVSGADVISQFIMSGFQAFNAVSSKPCKPFDTDRDGITLGEGAATIILSTIQGDDCGVSIMGGASSNDANHISAPSRTGQELAQAISASLKQAQLNPSDIDLISAHGTATVYNDEMEAKAINLVGLSSVPLNSLKGYYGHTLGAAGIIETIITIESLKKGLIIPTLGFSQIGVSTPVNTSKALTKSNLKNALKTASGFGGCNAALIFGKSNSI